MWHYKDPRLQSQQGVQENQDRSFNYVTMYRVGENTMVRIADEEVPDIQITGRGQWAIGTSDQAYELMANLNGQSFRDVYAIDTKTGKKTVIKKNLRCVAYEEKSFSGRELTAGWCRERSPS